MIKTKLTIVCPDNLSEIVMAQKKIWSNILMLFISHLAETNRASFDLPNAKVESVAGYNVEYAWDEDLIVHYLYKPMS
ncbi:hypothetical protein FNV43_RR27309 [Rhamnella rubrinervis]|uniref:Uncharacterized protein n=1 Tax=Rhamnella rubrinervis TaxID=2594499 RepID=A0A8K0DQT2_9ROSA|nr:hypothetical protein FNV43_RR27309 [Rhamnella rubrinervis]